MSIFDRLRGGLSKTRGGFTSKIGALLTGRRISEELFEELEEALIEADMGVQTSMNLIMRLRDRNKQEKFRDGDALKAALIDEIKAILAKGEKLLTFEKGTLQVLLVTGVNGVGKTTTIGKLAHRLHSDGYRVLLCAADTFRAAAADQLELWAKRANVDIVRHNEGADPGAVVFDGIQAAKARKADVLIVDTAGRLHNKSNLMAELGKIRRIIDRELPGGDVRSLLVLDASTGQNGISQAHNFGEIVDLDGIVLTKIDGTAKGGIIVGIIDELEIPVSLIGIGEGMEDLRDFEANAFADALFADKEEEANG